MLEKPGTVTVITADPHIGSELGLSLPSMMQAGRKGEEVPYVASAAQLWLHQNWGDFWDYVKFLAGVRGKYRKHRILTINMGDTIDGNHHQSIQCLKNIEDQITMASEIFTQVANLSDGGLWMIQGTEAHCGPNGAHEERVSKNAGAREYSQSLLKQIGPGGPIILAYHKGLAGKKEWTSSASTTATRAILNASRNGEPVPNYIFTAHHHVIDDTGIRFEQTRAISCPAFQLRTAFGHGVAPEGTRSDIGGMIVRPDGSLDDTHARYKGAPGQRKFEVI